MTPEFAEYQITTRTSERFRQLRILMDSNSNIRIRIPGFVISNGKNMETYNKIPEEEADKKKAEENAKLLTITDINAHNNAQIGATEYYHLLGTGIAANRSIHSYSNIKYIAEEISTLLIKYPDRIDFGLVGNNHKHPPSNKYLHLWGSNNKNIKPDAIYSIENIFFDKFKN